MSLKKTSDPIAISFGLTESAANTFTEEEVALQLDVLNNEVFVVLAIDLDPKLPDAIAATDTAVKCAVSSTSFTFVPGLSTTNCLATGRTEIQAAGFVDGGVGFDRTASSTYAQGLSESIGGTFSRGLRRRIRSSTFGPNSTR